jgi:hypothetical protein
MPQTTEIAVRAVAVEGLPPPRQGNESVSQPDKQRHTSIPNNYLVFRVQRSRSANVQGASFSSLMSAPPGGILIPVKAPPGGRSGLSAGEC